MPAQNFGGPRMPDCQNLTSEDTFYLTFGAMVQQARQSVSGRVKGYLSIDGRSLSNIMMDTKYSEEDIDALIKHMVEKRPKLVAALKSYDRPAADLIFTGHLPTGTDLSHMGLKITEALDADQKEASRDKCRWASMVWKWQEKPSK